MSRRETSAAGADGTGSTLVDESVKLALIRRDVGDKRASCRRASRSAVAKEIAMNMNTQQIVIIVVIGIVAGWLASLVVGGGGILRYLITGLVGAFVGGFVFNAAGWKLNIGNEIVEQIIVAAIGAIIVVILARAIA
jgi:uncharacterized membrane protein YeaQ/YmgE (transglycosylase-associated protein family)